MTSIRREPTNRLDTLMCVCFLGLHDASYTEVSSHLLASQQFQCPLDIGPVTGRGSINREGRSIQQTLYLRLGSSPDKQIGRTFLRHFDSLYMRLCLSSLRAQTCCQNPSGSPHLRCSTPPF